MNIILELFDKMQNLEHSLAFFLSLKFLKNSYTKARPSYLASVIEQVHCNHVSVNGLHHEACHEFHWHYFILCISWHNDKIYTVHRRKFRGQQVEIFLKS